MKTLNEIYSELYKLHNIVPNRPDHNNCDKGSLHSYIDFYEQYFSSKKENVKTLLEIGIQGGVSMIMWKEYFQNASIYGVDIDFSRIHPYILNGSYATLLNTDATKPTIVDLLTTTFDVIIDDGEHSFDSQITSFLLLKNKLNKGGCYIIEDIQTEQEAEYLKNLIPGSYIVDLRKIKNRYDDLLLVYENKE
jgi:cephalosporin hydroxylase